MTAKSELGNNWLLLFAASMGVICSSIVLPFYSIGALVVPITTEFGWSRAEFQLNLLFSTGAGVITSPIVGWLLERVGVRRIALSGLVGLTVALIIASQADGEIWLFYLAYTAMAVLGAGTIPVTWTRAVNAAFSQQRGLALGIMLSGTGICAIVIPQYAVWLVESFGWRIAYLGLAALPLLLAGPFVYLFFRPRELADADEVPDAPATGFTVSEAVAGYRFWVLLLSIFFVYIVMSGIITNLIPALTDQGIDAQLAATAISVLGVSVIAGRLIVGYLVDHYWAPGVAAVAISFSVFASLIFLGEPGFLLACVAAALLGFAAGAELDLMSFLAAKYFGLLHYAKIYSLLYAALAAGTGLAPSLFAYVFDTTGTYESGFVLAAFSFGISCLLLLALGRYPLSFATRVAPG